MVRTIRLAAVAAVLMSSAALTVRAQSTGDDRFVGNWVGTLQVPNAKFRLALTVKRDAGGALSGSLTSIDQGNTPIPGALTIRGDTVDLSIVPIRARYTGVITKDSLIGTFTQGLPFPLTLVRGAMPVLVRPQEPKPPFPYTTEDVTFESVPGVRLAGTIVMPQGKGPFPAVVFVSGSGAQNRDEELLGHKPFLVIADYLARHGIASLRYDDRGTAKSTGKFVGSTSADFAKDAIAAVNLLTTKQGIARGAIGVIGHSEGGLIAPMMAVQSRNVAFIVMLAGPGLPGDSILLMQNELIARAQHAPQIGIDRAREANSRLYAVVKTSKDSADADAELTALSARMVNSLDPGEQALARTQLAGAKAELLGNYPWMKFFLDYDPRSTLRQVRVPVLALNGSLDLQVPPKEDLAEIEAALKASGNKEYKVVELPGLNHLFQPAKTGNPAEYSQIETTFSPDALALIAEWITAHVKR